MLVEVAHLTKIVLLVSDLRRSRQFYQGLGFRVVRRHEDGLSVAFGEDTLELRSDGRATAGPHYFTPEISRFPRGTGVELVFPTAEIDRLHERARSLDVDIVAAVAAGDRPGGGFGVSDPDGYLLRFVPMVQAMAADVRTAASRA